MVSQSNGKTPAPSVVQGFRSTPSEFETPKSKWHILEIVVMWLAYVLMVGGNAIIEGGQFAGTTSASVAYSTYTWFSPAGYVFSIWSVIYVGLFIWLVAYTRNSTKRLPGFTLIPVLFTISSALNVVWLMVWHLQLIELALVVIILMWGVLAALYLKVRGSNLTLAGKVPISIYAAWITVATTANMAIVITRALNGSTPLLNGISVVLLVAGVLSLGYYMKKHYSDRVVQLVFLWAVVGVGVHVLEVSLPVAVVAFSFAVLAAIVTYVPFPKRGHAAHAPKTSTQK